MIKYCPLCSTKKIEDIQSLVYCPVCKKWFDITVSDIPPSQPARFRHIFDKMEG